VVVPMKHNPKTKICDSRKSQIFDSQKSGKPKMSRKSVTPGTLAGRYLMVQRLRKQLSEVEAWQNSH
jgi:hypothetical protein